MVFEWFEWPKQNRVTYVRSEWTYECGSCAAVWYVLRCCLLCGSAECVCCLIRSSAKAIDLLHSVCQKLIELMTSAIDLCGIQMSATDENCWKNCWQSFTPFLKILNEKGEVNGHLKRTIRSPISIEIEHKREKRKIQLHLPGQLYSKRWVSDESDVNWSNTKKVIGLSLIEHFRSGFKV